MPEPTMVPTTIAALIHLPSIRDGGSGVVSMVTAGSLIGEASHLGPDLAMRAPKPNRPPSEQASRGADARVHFSGAGQPGRGHGRRACEGEPHRARHFRGSRRGARA